MEKTDTQRQEKDRPFNYFITLKYLPYFYLTRVAHGRGMHDVLFADLGTYR